MAVETLEEHRCYGGIQDVYRHQSAATGTPMTFSVFTPPGNHQGPRPVLWYLSGLTCTWENATTKGQFQQVAAELGLVIVCPDTSPRGTDLPGEHEAYDLGSGAGFYVDATVEPWSRHYRMASYVTHELPDAVRAVAEFDPTRQGIFGHSMGGHGALTIALRHGDQYRTVSAFAPICSPLSCEWGDKALTAYLGPDRTAWRDYDACALVEDGKRVADILVDQGLADSFLTSQLQPERLEAACGKAGIPLTLRRHDGYDHSYYFIASFMADHLRWHAERLSR